MRTLFVLSILIAVSACSHPESTSIRFGLANAPISLDPRFATDATSSRINRLLYQRLVDFDDRLRPVPSMATMVRLSDTHYRFHLKKSGRLFDNGSRLTARDVMATYQYVMDRKNASPHRGSLASIKRMEVISDDEIDFFLSRTDSLFPGYLTIGILPKEVIDNNISLDRQSLGSGPFRFVDWPGSGNLVIERRSDKQRVEFIPVKDATVRVLKLLRGEIDLLQNDLPVELVSYLKKKNKFRISGRPGSNFTYLGLNMREPLLQDTNVRKAIAYAIDRKTIIKYLLGSYTRVANAILTPGHWAGYKGGTPYSYKPGTARSLLERAGYNKENPLILEYKTSSDPLRIRIATIIQKQLKEVGIEVRLRSFDWATVYGDIKEGRFQLYSLSWVGIKNPDIFRYVFHSQSIPPRGANRGAYNSLVVDRLIEEADQAENDRQSSILYQEIQKIVLDELPYIPLWYEGQVLITAKSIEDYRLMPDGNYDGLLDVRKQKP
ncbi:MAG TPA: ABC transporter substrate-binding protein [Gammaproteobacteria bacterium]|nr:ABC transporter substrate-binding protein [Gammaproteobacteria bacterium]